MHLYKLKVDVFAFFMFVHEHLVLYHWIVGWRGLNIHTYFYAVNTTTVWAKYFQNVHYANENS